MEFKTPQNSIQIENTELKFSEKGHLSWFMMKT